MYMYIIFIYLSIYIYIYIYLCQGAAKPSRPGYTWVDRKCFPPASGSGGLVGLIEALRDNHGVIKQYFGIAYASFFI